MKNKVSGGDRFIEASKDALILRVQAEFKARRDFILPVHLDLPSLLGLVGNLQLALRHPAIKGTSVAMLNRHTIDSIIERLAAEGFPAHAEAMRLGDDTAYDEVREAGRSGGKR